MVSSPKRGTAQSTDYTTDRIALARLLADLDMHASALDNERSKAMMKAKVLDPTIVHQNLSATTSLEAKFFVDRATELAYVVAKIRSVATEVRGVLGVHEGRWTPPPPEEPSEDEHR